jgi:hypothetical protein
MPLNWNFPAKIGPKTKKRVITEQAGLFVMSVRSAIFCSRWAIAARLLSYCDSALGRLTMIGAGFVAPGLLRGQWKG